MESRAHSGSFRRFALWMPALVAGFFVVAALAPAMAGAAYFNVSPDDPADCIWIRDFLPDTEITITIDDPGTGGADFVLTRLTDGAGNYNFDSEPRPDFSVGWHITVDDGVSSVTHTVFNVGIAGFDVSEDSCWGWSEALSSSVNVGFWCDYLGTYIDRVVPTNFAGNWFVDFTDPVGDGLNQNQGADLKITDTATVTQGDGAGGATQTNGRPFNPMVCTYPNEDIVDGWQWTPTTNVTINIDEGGAGGGFEYSETVQADEGGNLRVQTNSTYDIKAGDVVSATDGTWSTEMTVTAVQITAVNVEVDYIWGTAEPDSWVYVNVFTGTALEVQADINGDWSVSAGFDMVVGADVQASQLDEDGDRTQFNWHVANPRFAVDPTTDHISGWEWGAGTPLFVTVDGAPAGTPICDGGGNFDLDPGVDIHEGSIVAVTDGSTPKSTVVTALTITELNDVNDTISGTAAINSYVHVWVYNGGHRLVQADGGGFWTAYFAIPVDGEQVCSVDPGSSGNANQVDTDSDETQIQWHLANPSFGVDPDTGDVWGGDWTDMVLNLSVDDPATTEVTPDFQTTVNTGGMYWGTNLNDQFDIEPGHVVRVWDSMNDRQHTVAALSLTEINLVGNSVAGTGPEGQWLIVSVGNWAASRNVQVSGGYWVADFSVAGDGENTFDIVLGTGGEVHWNDTDNDTTRLMWHVLNPHFGADPAREEIWGNDFAPSTTVTITVNDGAGGFERTADTDWQGSFGIGFMGEYDLVPGSTVSVTDGITTKDHAVIDLVITDIDPGLETISGTAGADRYVGVDVYEQASREVMADGSGNWTAIFSTGEAWEPDADIYLGSQGEARQGDDDSDYTRVTWRLANPQFGVDPEREEVFGSDFAQSSEVTITIDDGAAGYQTTAWTDEWGNFSTGPLGVFDLQVGHIVTVDDGTQVRNHTVQYLTVDSIDAETDTVSGSTDPSVQVQVDVYGMAWRLVDSNGSGAWTADFMNPGNGGGTADIDLGTEGEARRHDEDGDFTRAMWRLLNPHIGVDPGREEIWGNDFAPWTTVTIAINDPGVIGPVDWQTTTETDWQGNFGIGFMGEYNLAPDYIVTVTDGTTTKNHTVIDLVVTNIDTDLETVSGTAQADRYVGVDVYEQASREVMASGSGNWTADFSTGQQWEGLADIDLGTQGEARQGDDDNDYTRATWRVLNVQVGVDPGRWEEIWGTDFESWGEVSITIDDPGTTLSPDYATTAGTDDMGNFGVSLAWDFDIQPGHVVMVTDGITTHVHEVIDLIVTDIDVGADTVSGTGAPGGWVDVDVYGMASRGAQVDQFGNWMVNFAEGEPWEGTADIIQGTQGEARQHDGDWDYTRTVWHVLNPRFTVNPEDQGIYGNDFAPSTTVTIMIDDPIVGGPIDWQTTVETDAWGDFGAGFWGEFELLPGHVITVTDGVTTKGHTVLSVQVTGIDPDAETVSGTADPFAWVQVNVWDSGAGKQVQADEFGDWTADFSIGEYDWEFADIMLGSEGSAQRWDEDSDMTEDAWRLANPCISMRPWDDNFGIYDFPRNTGVTLEIDDPGIPGAPDFMLELTTDDWGNVEEWLDPAVFDLKAGQTVTVTSGVIVKSHTITTLSITSIDPDTDTMTGTSNPAFPVVVYNWWYEGEWYPAADASGNWTLTSMPLDPMNEGAVAQWDEDGDSTDGGWRILAPRIEVNPDVDNIRFYDWPTDAEIAIEIDDPGIPGGPDYSGLLTPDEWGNFELMLDPATFDIHAGQTITATFGAIVKTHTVTSLSITTAQEGMLTGTGDFGTEVNFADWQGWWWGQRNVWPDESGNWTFPDEQLSKGGSGDASQWDDDWDYTRVEWHILNPAFAVDLTYRNMDGWDWLPSADLAITIDRPGTVPNPDYTYSHVTDESGSFWFDADGAGLDVIPGDIITVTDGQTLKTHEVFDVAVTSADIDTDIVAGTFEPDAWLSVSAWTPTDGQDRAAQCDGVGDWSIDFKTSRMGNPPLDLVPGSDAQAWVGDDDGDVTRSTWHIPDPRFRVSPMYEEIYGEEWPADTSLLITYDDPTTGLLPDVTTSTVTSPIGDFQMNLAAAGVNIKTGDIVTVTDGETLKEHIVLPVSVSGVNPDNDTVWGTATPQSMVWVSIDDQEYWGGVEVEADESGNWTADFSFFGMGSWDIVPDTNGNVNQSDDDNDETWVSWSAGPPRFTVAPNSDGVWGVNWENNGEVSISIDDPHNGLSVDWQDVAATSEWLGEFWIETTGYDVLPGDIVTVTDGSSTKTHTVTALTVAGADIDTNVVYGATDSNETVRVGYFPDGWWGPALVEVQPDLTWTYDFDLNDPPLDLRLGDEAAADQVDADGDSTWVDWVIVTPVPIADEATTNEDTTLVIDAPGLLGNDVYNPGETAIAVDTTPLHGDLTVDADTGAWTYVPDANWAGQDSFTYVLNQGTHESAPATVIITVMAVNDAPVANTDADVTPENTMLNVAAEGVLANDTDVEDDPLTAIKVTDPTHGAVTVNANGSYTYTPDVDYSGIDSFTYKANDGQADSNFATVTIYVTSENVPPTAVSDTATTPEDTPLNVSAPGVLGNDDDVNDDPISAIKVTDPAHGTVTLNANGSYTYTPAANYFGPDSFTYKANDGLADSNTVTVNITVTPVNDAPIAVADSYTVVQDMVLTMPAPGVLLNDTDIDSASRTAELVFGVGHGTLELLANGSFVYTPTPGYIGADSFTYRAHDGAAYSSAVTVLLYVNPVDLVEVPISGATRFATSVAVSQQAFPDGSDWVVIATGRNWPDALGGSALAGALGGPILLTDTTVMPADVVAEIERLGATNAIILGGTTAVAPAVETALNTLLGAANVERIGEGSRYLTADAVAARTIQELGAAYDGTAFMATGTNYPDALAAAPLAAGLHWPLYLTRPTGITPETYTAMTGVTEVLVLGGTGAVPAMIETSLVSRYGDPNVTRLYGNSRYETAVAVATYGVNHGLGWNMLALATGEKFPDALAGGILQGLDGSVMLLTKSNSLDPAVAAVLTAHSSEIREVRYLGGTGAISQAVRDAVANILD